MQIIFTIILIDPFILGWTGNIFWADSGKTGLFLVRRRGVGVWGVANKCYNKVKM